MATASRGTNRTTKAARYVSATLLIVTLALGFLVVNNEISQRARAFTPTVGLVNEDLSAQFNDDTYAFGTSFVDRVSKDSEYNWTVLSRPVAEKAFKDGSVDAVIYLPQSFSHDILTLQDHDPTRATVEYKLRPQVDEQSDRVLKGKIVDIVYGFNQSVVKMYFASIADNIAEADGYMNAALLNQRALIAAFASDVEQPFSGTMPTFGSFVSSATGLTEGNAATVEAQNSFADSVTDTLSGAGESLSATLPGIQEYANRQKEIAQLNATNSNTRIVDQATADREFYGDQFDWWRVSTLCKLNGVDDAQLAEPCASPEGTSPPHLAGQLGSLREAVADYAGSVGTLQNTVALTRDSLDTSIANLEALVALLEPVAGPTEPPVPTIPPTATVPSVPADPPPTSVPSVPIFPAFPTLASAVLQTLRAEIESLTNARDSLQADTGTVPQLETHLTNLDAWHADAVASVRDSALTPSTANGLEVKDWTSYTPESTDLYIDTSDELHLSIAELVTLTTEASGRIAGSKVTVPDNVALFDALLTSAIATFSDTETVHSGVNDLLSTGTTGLSKNQQFYQNFSTVLANTRAQGADTAKIHEFFSAPIDAKDITADRAAIPTTFDLSWVLVFAGGLLVGMLVSVLSRTFRSRKNA